MQQGEERLLINNYPGRLGHRVRHLAAQERLEYDWMLLSQNLALWVVASSVRAARRDRREQLSHDEVAHRLGRLVAMEDSRLGRVLAAEDLRRGVAAWCVAELGPGLAGLNPASQQEEPSTWPKVHELRRRHSTDASLPPLDALVAGQELLDRRGVITRRPRAIGAARREQQSRREDHRQGRASTG